MISHVGAAKPRTSGTKPLITVTIILTALADQITFIYFIISMTNNSSIIIYLISNMRHTYDTYNYNE